MGLESPQPTSSSSSSSPSSTIKPPAAPATSARTQIGAAHQPIAQTSAEGQHRTARRPSTSNSDTSLSSSASSESSESDTESDKEDSKRITDGACAPALSAVTDTSGQQQALVEPATTNVCCASASAVDASGLQKALACFIPVLSHKNKQNELDEGENMSDKLRKKEEKKRIKEEKKRLQKEKKISREREKEQKKEPELQKEPPRSVESFSDSRVQSSAHIVEFRQSHKVTANPMHFS